MANLTTLASGSSVVLTVADQQTIVLNNGRTDVARLSITTGPGAGSVVTASHNGRRVYGPFGAGTITLAAVSGNCGYELSGDSVSPLDDDAQPLTQTENQSVRALVSGAGSRRNVASKCQGGRLQTIVHGADYTCHTQFTIEAPADRFRIGFLNGTGADMDGCKANIGRLSQSGNKSGTTVNAGSLIDCTVAGSTTFTLSGTGGSNNDPIITWTDWMTGVASLDRTDTGSTGGTLPIHSVRLQIPSTVANRSAWYYTDLNSGWVDENISSAPYGRIMRMREQAVLAASNAGASGFTSTTNISAGVPFIVQYVPRLRDVLTIMVIGNSTMEGSGATIRNFGWDKELQRMLSTQDRPVEICNVAVGGAIAQVDEQRALRMISQIMPTILVCHAFNINDTTAGSTITSTEISTMQQRYAAVRAECDRLGIPCWVVTGLPGATATWPFGSTDSLRRDYNAQLLAFGARSRQTVIDFAGALEGADDGTGMLQLAAAYNADGTHPNTAGYVRLAEVMAPSVRTLLA